MDIKYEWYRFKEKMNIRIAWLLPKTLVMWCFYRVLAHASSGKYGNETPCGMTWETIADRWGDPSYGFQDNNEVEGEEPCLPVEESLTRRSALEG